MAYGRELRGVGLSSFEAYEYDVLVMPPKLEPLFGLRVC